MSRMWKRIILISAALLLAIGCAIWADRTAFRHFGYYDVETGVISVFTDGSEAFGLNNCEVSGGLVTITGFDPQFVVYSYDHEFSRIHIVFREPVSQNVQLQIFYAPTGKTFSEQNSVYRTIAAGLKEDIIPVPKATYTYLRFDFEQNVNIDKIYAGNEERIVLEYKPHIVRLAVAFSVIFIPLCILILIKTRKKKTDTENS